MPTTLRTVCFLFLLLAGGNRIPADSPPPAEFMDIPPPNRLQTLLLHGTKRLIGDTAHFRLTLPPAAKPEGAMELHLRLWQLNGPETTESLRLDPGLPPGHILQHTFTVDVSDWPDGQVFTSVRFHNAEGEDISTPDRIPSGFWIQRDRLAAVAEEYREEMKIWFEEINRLEPIWGKRPLWPAIDRALENPEAPFADLRGMILRSYWNPQLERQQPYTVYVPHSLDLEKPAPLMILLHGSGGDYRNLVADYAAGQRFEEHPMLIANAGAFRNLEFRHLALNDVRWIIEDMSRKYAVDSARVYVQGISLGGRGVLDLAALLPDTFAAVSSQGTYGIHRNLMDPLFPVHADPVAYRLAARNDIRTWLSNLGTTPVEMVFGWQDPLTRPVGALAIASVLETLNHRVVERGFDLGHNLTLPEYDWASTRAWFLQQVKPDLPRRIHFRVANLRFNRHAWIQVDALHDYSGVGEVIAQVRPNGELQIETRNIAQLRYLPPPMILEAARNFPAEARVYRFDEQNRLLEEPSPLADGKHPGQSGPLWNVFSEPFVLVVDDQVEDARLTSLRAWADRSAISDAAPGPFRFRVVTASELDEEDRRTRNLIWFTTPDSPHPWRELLPTVLPEAVRAFREENPANLLAIRPSPWNPDRLVLLAEFGHPQTPAIPHALFFQEHLQPDWVLMRGSQALAAGAYRHDWTSGSYTLESFLTRVLTR